MDTKTVTGVRIIPIYKNQCLFQLRDDKPGISHPNKWSFVSGSIESGESWLEAMKRECFEEIGLIPEDLHYVGHSGVSACFYAHLTDKEVANLVLGEGQEIRFFNPREMRELAMTPKLQELVTVYVESLEKLMSGEAISASDLGLDR